MKKHIIILLLSLFLFNCGSKKQMSVKQENVFMWEASNIYFLLTDRFKNGDTLNDKIIERIFRPNILLFILLKNKTT